MVFCLHISSAHQKRAPNLIIDGCESPRGCWELNSGPWEEQSMLLTSEPSSQPVIFTIIVLSNGYNVGLTALETLYL